MAKIIRTLSTDEGFPFECVTHFETENFVGVLNKDSYEFVLIAKDFRQPTAFNHRVSCKGCIDSLEELDTHVFISTGEHVTDVYMKSVFKVIKEE